MRKKWIATFIALCLSVATIGVLSACAGEQGPQGEKGEQGIQGIQGEAGKDGTTPTIEISEDGYWVINGLKTQYKAIGQDGANGENGENGRGIETVYYDANGNLVIVYTDKTEQTITLPVHTHVASEWIVDTKATCYSQGLQHKECTVCHTYMNIELIDEAHEWKTTYSYDETQHWIECTKCGDVKVDSLRNHSQSSTVVCPICGFDVSTKGIICEISEDGTYAKVVGYEGTEAIVYLPNEYQGVPVTHIESYAFEKNENIKRVFYPLNLTTIGSAAFVECPNLILFTPYGNWGNGDYALKQIEGNAFYECSSLAVVCLSKDVDDISYYAFNKCNKLRAVLVPNENNYYKTIDKHLYTKDGKTLVFYTPDSRVKSFTVPDGVETIGMRAFWGSSFLENITFPNTLKTIEGYAFGNCSALSSVAIPSSVEAIGDSAFYDCGNLKAIQLNNGLKMIGSSAFEYSGIESIVIPASVEMLKGNAFSNCLLLKTVLIQDNSNLSEIANFLFYEDTALESVIFGTNSSIVRIGNSSFYGCSSLKAIEIPEGVTYIDYAAFEGCSELKSAKFPTTLKILRSHSFYDCESLSEIAIPVATTSINHNAFTGCDALMKITVEKGNTVYHSSGNCIIETVAKKLLIGCTGSVLPQDDSVTEIGTWAFGDNPCLKKIEISEYIEKIDIMAFYNCGGLEEIIVNENNPVFHEDGNCLINTAEKRILRLCSNSIIPSDGSVTGIQDGAFSGCTIQNLYIPACIEIITVSGHNIIGLESIAVEEGNTNYYSSGDCLISTASQTLYIGCKNSVIPTGVKKIKSYSFEACEITSINIPVSIMEIETFAFLDCTLLKEIRYEGTREQWLLIEKGGSWDSNTGDYIVICSDGVLLKDTIADNISYNMNTTDYAYCVIEKEGNYGVFHFDATNDGVKKFILDKQAPELEYDVFIYRVRDGLLVEQYKAEGSTTSEYEFFLEDTQLDYSVEVVAGDRYYIVVKYVKDGVGDGWKNSVGIEFFENTNN